jgi:hypothetical protein
MLDDEILKAFMHNFFGYGNPCARVWFIGMEEGGGESEQEIANRLATWHRDGEQRLQMEDLAEFHAGFGDNTRFVDKAKIQSTWNKIIRTLLVAEGTEPTRALVRQYQIERLGRSDGDAALLELLPLPKPSMTAWPYAAWSNLPELATREAYQASILQHRIASITGLINEYQPDAVVFYGIEFRAHWESIAGMAFPGGNYPRVVENARLYMLLPHPVSRGKVAADFEAAGRRLSDMGIRGIRQVDCPPP